MARTRRAKRKSTRKKPARRRTTRRASARRTRTRRPRRTTRRKRSKGLTRKSQKLILIAAAVLVGLLLLIFLLQNPARTYVQKRWYGGEVGRHAVYGKVTSVAIGAAGRGTIHVQSFNTGKIYTFYTGVRTDYNIRRHPYAGETAKVDYINDRGYLKATYVRIR